MIDPAQVPPVSSDELLSRFITQSKQFRPSDGTVKPDAFIPYPHLELSVTRHLQATDVEIWAIGAAVAAAQFKTLCGSAEFLVSNCLAQNLRVEAMPVKDNPNHADIAGWPAAKQDQKAVALHLAAAARFVAVGA
jgi:hypothetical protein